MKYYSKVVILIISCIVTSNLNASIYYKRKAPKNYSIFTEEFKYPFFTPGRYCPFLYNKIENGGPFYTGFKFNSEEGGIIKEGLRYKSNVFILTFWNSSNYGKKIINTLYTNPYMSSHSQGGESAMESSSGLFPDIYPDKWYKVVYKIWQPKLNPEGISYMTVWLKDKQANKWTHITTAKLPNISKGFTGGATGFLERLNTKRANAVEYHRTNSYMLTENGWFSSNGVSVKTDPAETIESRDKWRVTTIKNNSIQVMRHSYLDEDIQNVPPGESKTFTFNQPETPNFNPIKFKSSSIAKAENDYVIKWSLDENSAPQSTVYVEVYSGNATGTPNEIYEIENPIQQELTFNTKIKNPTFKLVVVDLFEQTTSKIITDVSDYKKQKNLNLKTSSENYSQGLVYSYIPMTKYDSMDLRSIFNKEDLKVNGVVRKIDLSVHPNINREALKKPFAVQFFGMLKVPKTGIYQFQTLGANGYVLKVGNDRIIQENDFGYPLRYKSIFLEEGLVEFNLAYFNYRDRRKMDVYWKIPGGKMEIIPYENYVHFGGKSKYPSSKLSYRKTPIGSLNMEIVNENEQGEVEKVFYYSNDRIVLTKTSDFFNAEIFPLEGTNKYWTRTVYKNGLTATSNKFEYTHNNTINASGWTLKNLTGDAGKGFVGFDGKTAAFSGVGRYILETNTPNEFFLKMKVDQMDGGMEGSFVGILPSISGYQYGVFQTVEGKLSQPPYLREYGGKRINIPTFHNTKFKEPVEKWIAIGRYKNSYMTFFSFDGVNWQRNSDVFVKKNNGKAMIEFFSHPKDGAALMNAKVSGIKFENSFPKNLIPIEKKIEFEIYDYTFTGFVQPTWHTKLDTEFVLGKTQKGLYASEDFGKTWKPLFGNSKIKADGVIRSAVFDPKDENIIYVAMVKNGQSQILKSTNKGASWTKLKCPVKFSIDPKVLLMGDIISVNPWDTKQITVAGSNSGVFTSTNGGSSWISKGYKGEFVSFCMHYPFKTKGANELYIGLSSKKDLANWTNISSSRSNSLLIIEDLKKKSKSEIAVPPAGLLDIQFQKRSNRFFVLSTTQGSYDTPGGGNLFLNNFIPKLGMDIPNSKISNDPVLCSDLSNTKDRICRLYSFRMKNDDKISYATDKNQHYIRNFLKEKDEILLKVVGHTKNKYDLLISSNKNIYHAPNKASKVQIGVINK